MLQHADDVLAALDSIDNQKSAITAVGQSKVEQIFQDKAVTNEFPNQKAVDGKDTTGIQGTALQLRGHVAPRPPWRRHNLLSRGSAFASVRRAGV